MQQQNFKKIIEQMLKEKETKKNQLEISAEKILFGEFIKQWNEITKIKKQISTYDGYNHIIDKYIYPYFNTLEITLGDLRTDDLKDYMYVLNKFCNLSNCTIGKHYEIIKASLNYAVNNKLLKDNPCNYIKKPKKEKVDVFPYNEFELHKLMEVAKGDPLEVSIYLTIWYGFRRSEVLGLKWENIDFINNRIHVCEKVVRAKIDGKLQRVASPEMKTETSKRFLPMSYEIKKYLLAVKSNQEKNKKLIQKEYLTTDYVCVDKNGKPIEPDYLTGHFRKLLEKNELRHIRFHDLRHSCATLLINKNMNMKDVSEWLGHADITTTLNMYTHVNLERKNFIANTISQTLKVV